MYLVSPHPLHLSGGLNLFYSQEEPWLLSPKVAKALGFLPYSQRQEL